MNEKKHRIDKAVGVDIGGTQIKITIVSSDGDIDPVRTLLTGKFKDPKSAVERISKEISEIPHLEREIAGVGLACPGPVENRTGIMRSPPNLPQWRNAPLKKMLQDRIKLPVELINDADAAALGEYYFGCAKNLLNFAVITLGTGMGFSLILKGCLLEGAGGLSPELGHIPYGAGNVRCGCGATDHFESYISMRYLRTQLMTTLKANKKTMKLCRCEALETAGSDWFQYMIECAEKGDASVGKVFREYGENLGNAFTAVCNLFNVPWVILTGGLTRAWDYFGPSALQTVYAGAMSSHLEGFCVKITGEPEFAGCLGAACLVFSQYGTDIEIQQKFRQIIIPI